MPMDVHTPEGEARWLAEQHRHLIEYLERESVRHADVPDEPELHIPPYLALYHLPAASDSNTGWWVITGDVPTDHVSDHRADDGRQALRAFARKWRTAAGVMAERQDADNADGATPEQSQAAARHLFERAKMLHQLAQKDEIWGE